MALPFVTWAEALSTQTVGEDLCFWPAQWRIQKILVEGDLKHKTSKIRMSSPKLRVIFRPKSEIQMFFSPKFRWSPKKKKKKKKGLHLN